MHIKGRAKTPSTSLLLVASPTGLTTSGVRIKKKYPINISIDFFCIYYYTQGCRIHGSFWHQHQRPRQYRSHSKPYSVNQISKWTNKILISKASSMIISTSVYIGPDPGHYCTRICLSTVAKQWALCWLQNVIYFCWSVFGYKWFRTTFDA